MWFLIGAVGIGALITSGQALGGLWRWLILRRLPIVTPAEFAAAEPGTAVILTGRTATDPYRQTHRVEIYHYTGEGTSETVTEYPGHGDSRLHGDDGAAVDVDLAIRHNVLFPGRPAILTARDHGTREDHPPPGSTETFFRDLVTPADHPALAVGRVSAGRDRLEQYAPQSGSAIGDLATLARRDRIRSAWLGAGALLLAGVLILLIRL
jgi:hypothetical protein